MICNKLSLSEVGYFIASGDTVLLLDIVILCILRMLGYSYEIQLNHCIGSVPDSPGGGCLTAVDCIV